MAEGLAESARRLKTGERIAGKYRLKSKIAQGGMGAVWVAKNELTGADVALKVLRPDGSAAADVVGRFRHEARLGGQLRHRSITRVFDLVEEADGTLVLVMELLRGETVQALLRKKTALETREAIAIAVPILSALDHAHAIGIVHRDVKPANIFLSIDPDGTVLPKLFDFGIAKGGAQEFQTLEGRVLGTPAYMSPEQIRATTGELTGRSDLFAMGVVLYEMLTGSPPFDSAVPSAALAAVLEKEIDPDPRIEPRLWIEIERALSKRPNERHESARAMAAALCEAIGATETALAESLRRSQPPPAPETEPPPDATAPEEEHHPTAHGISRSIASIRPYAGRRGWALAAAGVAVCIALAAFVALRGGKTKRAPDPTAAATSASAMPASTIPPAEPLPPPDPPPVVAGTSSHAPGAPARPGTRPPKKPPRTIATTPGF